MNRWEKKKWLVICCLVLICTAGGLWAARPKDLAEGQMVPVAEEPSGIVPDGDKKLCVYVTGAVAQPGMYYASARARYGDVIRLAGGLTEQADVNRVNLAKKCKDGCQIHVPEYKPKGGKRSAGKTATGRREQDQSAARAAIREQGKVNINQASARELESLPGIGPALAQRIIQYRLKKRFMTVKDLQQVPGIGPAKLRALADRVEV